MSLQDTLFGGVHFSCKIRFLFFFLIKIQYNKLVSPEKGITNVLVEEGNLFFNVSKNPCSILHGFDKVCLFGITNNF